MTNMIKALLILILISTRLFSADYALISDLGSSAKMIGLGNIEGFSKNSSVLFENPAGLKEIKTFSFSVFSTTIIDDISYNSLSYAHDSIIGTFALGYFNSTVGNIYNTRSNSNQEFEVQSSFQYKKEIIKLGYQNTFFDAFDYGLAILHYRTDSLEVDGQGINAELGIQKKFNDIETSFTARNILPRKNVKYTSNVEENLPYQLVLSSKTPLKWLTLYTQLKSIQHQNSLFKSAAISIPLLYEHIELYVGGKEFNNTNNETKTSLSLGTAINSKHVSVQYAYETNDHIENLNTHHLSLSVMY